MNTKLNQVYWLAGLLEGEGCFSLYKKIRKSKRKFKSGYRLSVSPVIAVASTDYDVIARAASIFGKGGISTTKRLKPHKDYHTLTVFGQEAVGWMMTIYPLMCERRKARIREILSLWKSDFKKLQIEVGNGNEA